MEPREFAAWALAVFALIGVGVSVATRPSPLPAGLEASRDDTRLTDENQRLRSTLVVLRSEQAALRSELDRLLARLRGGAAGAAAAPSAPSPGADGEDDPARLRKRVGELSSEITELSGAISTGEPEGMRSLFARISQLQAMGPEALPLLKDELRSSDDPALKRILMTIISARGGEAEEQFLIEAAERESDPDLKQALLASVGVMGEKGRAAAREEAKALVRSSEAPVRASAIRGLTNLDDPELSAAVERALAEDPSEAVRLAALDALLRDPARRDEALRLAQADASTRIREIAECRERLAVLEATAAE